MTFGTGRGGYPTQDPCESLGGSKGNEDVVRISQTDGVMIVVTPLLNFQEVFRCLVLGLSKFNSIASFCSFCGVRGSQVTNVVRFFDQDLRDISLLDAHQKLPAGLDGEMRLDVLEGELFEGGGKVGRGHPLSVLDVEEEVVLLDHAWVLVQLVGHKLLQGSYYKEIVADGIGQALGEVADVERAHYPHMCVLGMLSNCDHLSKDKVKHLRLDPIGDLVPDELLASKGWARTNVNQHYHEVNDLSCLPHEVPASSHVPDHVRADCLATYKRVQ